MMPVLHPVKVTGWPGRYLVLGVCADRVGGNVWVVRAVADGDG